MTTRAGLRRFAGVGSLIGLRGRVLGWYALLLTAALAFSSFLTFEAAERYFGQEAEGELREEVFDFRAYIQARQPGRSPEEAARAYLESWPPEDREALVVWFAGSPFAAAGPVEAEPALADAVRATAEPRLTTMTTAAGEARILFSPVTLEGDYVGAVAAVHLLEEDRSALLRRRAAVLFAALLAFLLASVLAWMTLGRLLRPVKTMARTAETISREGDLSRRIPETGRADEVGVLAGAFNRMLNRLERAFRRERRFIREASHELRTPITICRGHLEVLGPNPSPEELRETLDLVVDELGRMGRVVEDMTTLARVEEPEFLEQEPVHLERFLPEVAAKAEPLLNGRLRVGPVPPDATLRADPQRLTQALINLLQNAAVHTRDSGVDLCVTKEPGSWRFEVADEGGGVPDRLEESVFEPFRRGAASVPGSGLGLAIVRGVAEAHGGEAGVCNRPGEGATFWIRMPR